METYSASLNIFAKIMTGFVFLLAIFGVGLSLFLDPWYGGLVLSVLMTITIVFTYIYSVQSYQITDEALVIKRPFSKFDKIISFTEIESVRLPDKAEFKWTIRTAGNGGLFGYSGYFMNNKLGAFRMFASNGKNKILIVLKNEHEKIVISPDDVEMLDVLQKHLKKQA